MDFQLRSEINFSGKSKASLEIEFGRLFCEVAELSQDGSAGLRPGGEERG